jgi:ribulose-phosphate 3-epimerase
MMALLAPSILSSDLLRLQEQVRLVEENGADMIHVDVMDGHFVPNITFGPTMVKVLKRITKLPLDVHLMITNPSAYIQAFAEAGADIITVHQEACVHLDRVLNQIREHCCRPGVSINPATPVASLSPILGIIDLVLIMTVNPGFGGQEFIPYTMHKIAELKAMKDRQKQTFMIEVDGGVNAHNARSIVEAGADILVAGHAIFGQDNIASACQTLKKIAGHQVWKV